LPLNRVPLLCLLACIASAACGTDAERPYAGLSEVERSALGVGYTLRYLAPPWKLRNGDPLVLGTRTGVSVGGRTRSVVKEGASVLEIGTTTVAQVPGENYPKYRLEAAIVRCDDNELGDTTCAPVLADAELAARADATSRPLSESGSPHYDVLAKAADGQRNVRVAFYDFGTSAPDLALWVYIESYPSLGERAIDDMLADITLNDGNPASEEP
jgi:hypothetical protein